MTYDEAKAKVDAIANGKMFSVDFTTVVKQVSAKAIKNGYSVKKHTKMVCRKGIEYSNTNYIKEITTELNYKVGERANGVKDANNKGFADSYKGNKLLDLFATDCKVDRVLYPERINRPTTEYIVEKDGNEIVATKAELKDMGIMQPAFFNNKDKEKVERMFLLKAEWEKDKDAFSTESKEELAKLIRDCYNKMFSLNVEHINSIG